MPINASVLVADIGGTSGRFALARATHKDQISIGEHLTVPTADFSSFEQMMEHVGATNDRLSVPNADLAVFAVPGHVDKLKANLANVRWDIDLTSSIQDPEKIHLLNDFEAQAFGCLAEQHGNFIAIKNGTSPIVSGMVAVGPGTGIGHCGIEFKDSGVYAHPSECGRWVFPFVGQEERRYQEFLERKTGLTRFRGDILLSGGGLALLHEFHTGKQLTPSQVAGAIDGSSATSNWFARFLARDCQHYVLSCFDYCDVLYITGGVAIKNPYLTDNNTFREEFVTIDNYRDKLDAIGIRLNTNEEIGLLGCAYYGMMKLALH